MITRDMCRDIVKKTDSFFVTETVINGYKVEMYSYRLVKYEDFKNNNAFELRGLTFVYNDKTMEWERNILLNKFFNINENEDYMLNKVKDKKIIRVQEKYDGSILSFIKFPDGSIRAKSKMSFESTQAVLAQEIYDNDKNLREFISYCFNNNLVPVFELIGYKNTVVLNYDVSSELVLLQVRDSNGNYVNLDSNDIKKYEIKTSNYFQKMYTLEELLELKKTEENIEGWVVTFEDGQMAKIKTDWYIAKHGLISEIREDNIIKLILNEEIDDILSELDSKSEKYKEVIRIQEKIDKNFNELVIEFKELRRKYFQDSNENRKEFAINNKNNILFSYVIKTLNTSFRDVEKTAEEGVKQYILKQCNGLNNSKSYLEKL